jgi:segregation and condensation protein A
MRASRTRARRVVWSLAEAREALSRLLGVALDWIDMDHWLIAYCPDPALRRTARASALSASLELVREGKLELRQDRAFAPIWARVRAAESTQATQ